MPKVTCIIPARNEPYLVQTIDDLIAKATGEVEVVAVLENYWPDNWLQCVQRHKKELRFIHHGQPHGMRASINEAAANAEGEYLLKSDAHCLYAPGWDEELRRHCDHQTIMVPRRYRLDAANWKVVEDGRPPIDYEYLTPPEGEFEGLKGKMWDDRRREREHIKIDDLWLFQGSCWFMRHSYFNELDLMDETNYGTFWKEALELSMKAWLSGGRVAVNKNVWYAHLHKPKRGYTMPDEQQRKAHAFCLKWLSDSSGWAKQTLPFTSLLERFQPPGWENWKGTHGVHQVQEVRSVSLEAI